MLGAERANFGLSGAVMQELLRSFAYVHVLGLTLVGCLALAVVTGQSLWMYIGLSAAAIGCPWAAVLLYRDLHRTGR